jgi:hypothetical protein
MIYALAGIFIISSVMILITGIILSFRTKLSILFGLIQIIISEIIGVPLSFCFFFGALFISGGTTTDTQGIIYMSLWFLLSLTSTILIQIAIIHFIKKFTTKQSN